MADASYSTLFGVYALRLNLSMKALPYLPCLILFQLNESWELNLDSAFKVCDIDILLVFVECFAPFKPYRLFSQVWHYVAFFHSSYTNVEKEFKLC